MFHFMYAVAICSGLAGGRKQIMHQCVNLIETILVSALLPRNFGQWSTAHVMRMHAGMAL